jgi:hypothetical protein
MTKMALKKYKPPPPNNTKKDSKHYNNFGVYFVFFRGETVGPFLYFLGGFLYFLGGFLVLVSAFLILSIFKYSSKGYLN